jgi:superfamily II DNA/RNA helicase
VAITLVADDEIGYFRKIERFIERDIHKNTLPEGIGEAPEYKVTEGGKPSGKSNKRYRGKNGGKQGGRQGGKQGNKGNYRRNNKSKNTQGK